LRLLFLLFLVTPIVEMYLLIRVGQWIGAWPTIGLVAFTAVVGVALLRQQGFATLLRGQQRMAAGEMPAEEMMEGLALAVGGALLLTPGFATDTLGFALLLPFTRRALVRGLLRRGVVTVAGGFAGAGYRGPGPAGPHVHRGPDGSRIIEGEWERADAPHDRDCGCRGGCMDTTRRTFTTLLAGAVALSATRSAAASPAAGIRSAFEFPEERVPMNAANLCPSPRSVAEAVTRWTEVIDRDCSFQNRAQFRPLLEASRSAVAGQLGVSPDTIALVRNTSEANNIVNAGLDLGPGDEVVVWEQNHPTNLVAWDVRAARYGFRVVRVAVPADPRDADALLEPFRRALTPRTRVLTATHVSNISGLKLPIAALAALCRDADVHFHVDGAQSWGAVELDLAALGCDSFSGSAHKWYLGPKEVGLLYVRPDRIDALWPAGVAPGWGDDADTDLVGARKFESLGQRDDAALAALAEAAAIHGAVGPANVEAHMTGLATRLKEGLLEAGASLVTPLAPEFSGGVCIAAVAPEHRRTLFDALYREHGIIGAPTGGLRLSPHLYNTIEHVDRAVAAVRAHAHLLS
jgi:selenocysteine lyase/cysteine desulfurase/UPF0716 family protein affecting phage T7 exclusion